MSERSISSFLDRFRKKKGDKAEKSESVLTEQENTRLKGYLIQAKEQEKVGNQTEALKLYSKYKQEFLTIQRRGRESDEDISPEVQEALSEFFTGEILDKITLPKPEELTDEYFDRMYPKIQDEEDKAHGLISYRPSWWNEKYTNSMKAETAQFQDKLVFSESIQKPNYTDGSQQYSVKKLDESSEDPLLPLIREVFGENKNRFNLTWDQINNEFLPNFKSRLERVFKSKGISIPKFDVILTPALASNIQMTKERPENSQTNTYEWTSTPFLNNDGTDSGHRLLVGHSGRGGAGYVNRHLREYHDDRLGFRLSVVFEK